MCIPPRTYKDMGTANPTTGIPALMYYQQLVDLLELSDNLPELESIQHLMEIAEMQYSEDQWQFYATQLVKLYHGRRLNMAVALLNAK